MRAFLRKRPIPESIYTYDFSGFERVGNQLQPIRRTIRGHHQMDLDARELRVIADAAIGISFRVLRALLVSDQMIRILLHFQDRQRKKEV